MDTISRDLRFALRALLKSPGFAAVAILTLGLGIGATTTIFTLINTLFLRPPAQVREPGRLVALYTSDYSGPRYGSSSYADYLDFRTATEVLEGLAAYAPRPVNLSLGGETTREWTEEVSGNYFDVLGVKPVVGRTFVAEEDRAPGNQPVVVIGHGLWQRRFGGAPDAVGRSLRVNGASFTVIGVAPPGFTGSIRGIGAELWVPFLMHNALHPGSQDLANRGSRGLLLVGRLKPGVSLAQVRIRFAAMARQQHDTYPDWWTDVRDEPRAISVLAERDARVFPGLRGAVMGFMALLLVVSGLVLLICCANVANLLLARATARRQEMAIRLALGAGRGRLLRQLLTESVVLSVLGGLTGVVLASWGTGLLATLQPPVPVPVALDFGMDGRVLAFSLAVGVLAGLLFGLAPAIKSTRPDLVPALKDELPVMGSGRRLTLRDLLVVGQVAVSLVLLIAAGLFLRSLIGAQTVDPGFNPDRIALLSTELSIQGYPAERGRAFYAELLAKARTLPGVEAVALAQAVPLGVGLGRQSVEIEGHQRGPGEDLEFGMNLVSPGYFRMMQIPVVAGREFSEVDREGARAVAIVNQSFAQRFWPGESALGKRIRSGSETYAEVVGIAKDGKYGSLGEDARPYFYLPFLQNYAADMTLQVRYATDPGPLLQSLGHEVKAIDPDLPIRLTTMEEHLGVSLLPHRLGASVLGTFGLLGLALAAMGLYGVIAYTVSSRTRELGIRISLGAQPGQVLRLVLVRGLWLIGAGLGIGLALALGLSRLLIGLLFGISPADPLTFLGIPVVLAAVALLATYIPALRATRVDPVVALKSE